MTATTAGTPFAGPGLWVTGALPSGISEQHMFVVVFVVMLPILPIHGEAIRFGSSPQVAAGYAVVAVILYACARKAFIMPVDTVAHEEPAP